MKFFITIINFNFLKIIYRISRSIIHNIVLNQLSVIDLLFNGVFYFVNGKIKNQLHIIALLDI